MKFCAIRIDERLIHGQVATAWTREVNATRIMIIDDEVVKDSVQKMALKSAVPMGIKLSILTLEKALTNFSLNKYDDQNVFLIVKDPKVLVHLNKAEINLDEVIIGNMSAKGDSKVLYRTVSVTNDNLNDLKFLVDEGINVNLQMVPKDKKIDIKTLI